MTLEEIIHAIEALHPDDRQQLYDYIRQRQLQEFDQAVEMFDGRLSREEIDAIKAAIKYMEDMDDRGW